MTPDDVLDARDDRLDPPPAGGAERVVVADETLLQPWSWRSERWQVGTSVCAHGEDPPAGRFDQGRIIPSTWRPAAWTGDDPVTGWGRMVATWDRRLPGWQGAVELGIACAALSVLLVEYVEVAR